MQRRFAYPGQTHRHKRSTPSNARIAPIAVLMAITSLLVVGVSPASASLEVYYSAVGPLQLSVDGIGTNATSSTIQVEKPAGGTVRKAYLFAASTGFSGFTPPDGEITLEGSSVAWDSAHTILNSIDSVNVAADVTSIVEPKLDAASPGRVTFTLEEADTLQMDGEILAVVFDDPNVRSGTIDLLYGAQSTTGDHFDIGLPEPLRPSSEATMGLGISYGDQPSGQYSEVKVNGTQLTSSAGGQDDCSQKYVEEPDYGDLNCGNGALITAGGVGDKPDNPSDPFATDWTCMGAFGLAPRCDDELYALKPFVAPGETSIGIDSLNPSNDDNIFFASLDLTSTAAVVGAGAVVSPTGTRSQVGTIHYVTVLAQNGQGQPEAGRSVTLNTISGPNLGRVLTGVTNSSGQVVLDDISALEGTDTLEATFTDRNGALQTSNDATQTWTPHVVGTFGGEWPYTGNSLPLYYSYGGSHRYLGNAVQGAANWNNAGTKVHLAQWPSAPFADEIPFVDVYEFESWWGLTVFAHQCATCGFTRNTIELNTRTLDPESDAQRTKVATHELGHALGLEHPYGFIAPSTPSVMWRGILGTSGGYAVTATPQPFDIKRVNEMYP